MMRASEESPKMFENEFFDFFSRTWWLTVPIVYVPVIAWSTWASVSAGVSLIALPLLLIGGFVAWTLTEYWLHRTAFHWEPDTWWGPKFHFFVHGVHHKWVLDPYRLVMPPAVSLVLAVIFYGLFSMAGALLSGFVSPAWHLAAYAGFVAGYVNYDCTHYILHHWKPTSERYKSLRAHHMNHHHTAPDRKFGVSFQIWDKVFDTD